MRHPTTGQSEGDLSRLTGTSTTSSTPSSSNDNLDIENNHNNGCNDNCAIISSQALILSVNDNENANNLKNSQHLNQHRHHHHHHHHHHGHHKHHHHHPSYLPEFIDPLEWQKSRKRKERLDSTSSITQVDRKLQRSNSEELITSSDCEVIRRVSSHEDFKKQPQPLQEKNINTNSSEDANLKTIEENDNNSVKSSKLNRQKSNDNAGENQEPNNIIKVRLDTSPARSHNHRWSPSRSDDSECENERRRSSERFSKTRAPPGRKSGVVKKVSSNSGGAGKYSKRAGDENAYKYDISHLKYERRGFVSKIKLEEQRARKEEAADGEQISRNDYNDNNLIDLCVQQQQQQQKHQQQYKQIQQQKQQKHNNGAKQEILQQTIKPHQQQTPDASTAAPLPWDRSSQESQTTPVLCRRFAAFQDDENNSPNCNNNNQDNSSKDLYSSQSTAIIAAPAVIIDNEPMKSYRTFTKMENLKTREVMQSLPPLGLQQEPEERLKYINKKLNALKKRITQLEENFEKTYGYRPSQIERFNDKQIKSVLAEINKLRKEKQDIKSDPMATLGLKISGGLDAVKKLEKMKDSLSDIEKKLTEKRAEVDRPENLDILNSDQLVQEKTAVQHSLLYFESIYGRPSSREERDAVRPLYDRYRTIKRMVTRSIAMSGNNTSGFELPTILEHEAMTYESIQQQSSISTDTTTNSLSDTAAVLIGTSIESPTDNSCSAQSTTDSTDSSSRLQQQQQQQQHQQEEQQCEQQQTLHNAVHQTSILEENLHMLSLDELWSHLEKVREEKKDLKKAIRDYENLFEEQNGRKMLKTDRKLIEDTYSVYKEKKAKARLLQALIKKHMAKK